MCPSRCGSGARSGSACWRPASQPYPVAVPRTHTLAEVRAAHPDLEAGDRRRTTSSGSAGRVVFVRNTGKLCFATLQDGSTATRPAGDDQPRRQVGEDALAAVEGGRRPRRPRLRARPGHLQPARRARVMADEWRMAAKALRPLPNLHEGAELSEEARVRQRYVDLIVRPEARDMVRTARPSSAACATRSTSAGFIEIETPMLQTLHGGAAARPFVTHMNALRHRPVPADRARAVPQARRRRRAGARSSRSTATSATRARTPRTAPSSRCSSSTRRTATTTRSPT